MDYLLYLFVPFAISVGITPLVKRIAVALGAYAEINERTIHTGKIARIGGVAIYVAFIVSMTCFIEVDATFNAILIGGFVMFMGGLIDDLVDLRPRYKFGFQVLAALIVMLMGNVSLDVIRLPLGIRIDMGIISMIVTFFWITGITNAINLIDGLDGLAGGLSAIVLIVIASLALVVPRSDVVIPSLILAGASLGFLIYNSYPASIFMGDCGSQFLGFSIAVISLLGFKGSTIITLALPILMLLIPIIDTLSAILRRTLAGHKFSDADRNHLHHALMRRFGHRNTVLILYAITALFGLTAYVYIVNKAAGLICMAIIMLGFELFIESSQMISSKYHPLLGIFHRLVRRRPDEEKETEKQQAEKEEQ